MTDPTEEEIDAHFEALRAQEEELASSKFGEAMDLAATLLSGRGKDKTELPGELAFLSPSNVGYEYYHACRVIYRLGVEAEDMWRELQGRKDPTEDLLERLQTPERREESESKDQIIFKRLKQAVEEEVADRPGCTPSRDGGLRYIFNIDHILKNDPWSRHVQSRLMQMNQWTNAMVYAYDKILDKLSRLHPSLFNQAAKLYDGFRNLGYWDDGNYIALEDKVAYYRQQREQERKQPRIKPSLI